MNIVETTKKNLQSSQYDFLRTNPHLGNNLILLGFGGSIAYGTNIENSDVDLRGIALTSKSDLLGLTAGFDQVVNEETDTTIYSLNKITKLLINMNPNTCELLGLKPEHYLYLSPIGKELLDNKKLFLSRRAQYSFGGYAVAQLRRLDNKAARSVSQVEKEQHVLNSITSAYYSLSEKYESLKDEDYINLYLDDSDQPDLDKEIFIDTHLSHYPLRDYKNMWSDMKTIISAYDKIGRRNTRAIEKNKLGKHMMHLIRLYLMCIDILEKEEINTYREKDIPFLIDIRNGKFLDDNSQPTAEFYDIIAEYEKRLQYAADNTSLPDKPNLKAIDEFLMSINERVVLENI